MKAAQSVQVKGANRSVAWTDADKYRNDAEVEARGSFATSK